MPDRTADEILEELYNDAGYRRDVYFSHYCLKEIQELRSLYRRYPNDETLVCYYAIGDEATSGLEEPSSNSAGLPLRQPRKRYSRGAKTHRQSACP